MSCRMDLAMMTDLHGFLGHVLLAKRYTWCD